MAEATVVGATSADSPVTPASAEAISPAACAPVLQFPAASLALLHSRNATSRAGPSPVEPSASTVTASADAIITSATSASATTASATDVGVVTIRGVTAALILTGGGIQVRPTTKTTSVIDKSPTT